MKDPFAGKQVWGWGRQEDGGKIDIISELNYEQEKQESSNEQQNRKKRFRYRLYSQMYLKNVSLFLCITTKC